MEKSWGEKVGVTEKSKQMCKYLQKMSQCTCTVVIVIFVKS